MAAITSFAAAGWDSLQWSKRSTLGYMTGAAGLAVTDTGESSSMARHRGANTADVTLPEPTIVNIPGDNTTIAQFSFEGDGLITFNIEMSVKDNVFHAAATGLASVSDGDTEAMPEVQSGLTPNSLFLLFSRDLKSQKAGQVGAAGYEHLELYNCAIRYLSSGWGTKAAAVYRYQVTVNNVDVLPDGRAVSAVYNTAPNGQLAGVVRSADSRYSYSMIVGDGVETQIVTAYKPISVAKSKATVETTGFAASVVSAIDTASPYGITPTDLPGSGKIAVARYEFLNYE